MASTEEIEQASKPAAAKPGVALLPLIVIMLATMLLVMGGTAGLAFWLYKAGKLPGLAAQKAAPTPVTPPLKPSLLLVPLEPLLVNLADGDGRSYLRIAVTLVVEQKPTAKGAKPKEGKPEKGKAVNEFEAAERDALLAVLGRETGQALLAPDGKDALKQRIRVGLQRHVPEVAVDDVLFTDFLVQR